MKNAKSYAKILLAMVLIFSLLIGCSKGDDSGIKNNGQNQENEKSTNDTDDTNEQPAVIDDGSELLTINLMTQAWNPGWEKDHPVVKVLEEKLNIILNIEWSPAQEYKQKINTLAAANNLPDFYTIWNDDFIRYQADGAFLDIKPYLDQYPNLKATYSPEILAVDNPSDKYYGVPWYVNPTRDSIAIRKDWLDHLNLSLPETLDELYDVAKAFTLNDPDQNGKDDTVGFSFAVWPETVGFERLEFIEGAFGVANRWKEQDGKLIPKQVQEEELKAFIGYMRKAYEDGIVDKDFPILKRNEPEEKFDSGKVGISTVNANGIFTRSIPNLLKSDPNAEMVQLIPPKGSTGLTAMTTFTLADRKNVINGHIDEKKQQRILALMDYMTSEEGNILINHGIEDVHYKRISDDQFEQLKHDDFAPFLLGGAFWKVEELMMVRKWDDPDQVAMIKSWLENNSEHAWFDAAGGLTSSTNKKIGADINTEFTSTLIEVIVGRKPMDAIDTAIATWKKNGGDDIIKEMNDEYQKLK